MLKRNAANLVVLLRTALVFPVIFFLDAGTPALRGTGVGLLVLVFVLDGADGWLARRWRIASPTGGLMDTLGDRITENLLFIFLAWKHLVPLAVPLIFVTRSFLADFVRAILFSRGIGTFAMHTSLLGRFLVSSKGARTLYLLCKFAVFFLGALVLWQEGGAPGSAAASGLRSAVWWGAVAATVFNLVRFGLLLADSRAVLREEFRD